MAKKEDKYIIEQGVVAWNSWRKNNPGMVPDLYNIDISGQNWNGADFTRTDFVRATLNGTHLENAQFNGALDESGNSIGRAYFVDAKLRNAHLKNATLNRANLIKADFTNADLRGADLSEADLTDAIFINADLTGANLNRAQLVNTNFKGANLTGCEVYGISTWDLILNEKTKQCNLVITPKEDDAKITVDNIQVAQFIYLLLNNREIRNTINTITSKAVLILGRFSAERKLVLDGIKDKLRSRNYLPIMFDFEKPSNRDLTETITSLAGLSKFIIADLTDAKSIPQELMSIVPNLLSVPVQPIILEGQREYAMFEHFIRYQSVLPIYEYTSISSLLERFDEDIILAAEGKVVEIA